MTSTDTTRDLRIDSARLYASLDALGRIGAYTDERTGLVGVCRPSLTDADADGRRLVMGWMRDAGLAITVDAIGNVYGRRAGRDDALPAVMCGSHVDSVPTAGRFDGCLGVLGGLEVVRTLDDAGLVTRRPLVVAFFTEEEGARFGTDMLGSAVATGRIALAEAHALCDAAGVSVGDELRRTGFLGDAPVDAIRPHAYVELHVEQGPVLARKGLRLGVVTGVQGISWQELQLQGRAAHAGTTPISYRADAGLVASLVNVRMRALCDSGDYGHLRATMGVIQPHPGAVNVIPGRVRATVDLRNPEEDALARAEADLHAAVDELAAAHGVSVAWKRMARTPPVPFDASVQAVIADVATRLLLSHEPIIAGAGHDAQEWARVAKTAMIFVPGEFDGISHNPRELSTEAQCADGANTLLHTLLALADEP
ncbi:MAG: M20 family metallo-hydrolase [Planctomycetes bacterium]|nr:M20 family metallo-hydrolase [Planctomycetota bacterium]